MRTAQWRPTIINRQGYVRWQEEGGLDLREKARRKALKLLETHQPEPLAADVAARIDALVAGFVPHLSRLLRRGLDPCPAASPYLSETDKAAIYEAALEIMETVGQRVHHAEALELLRAAGCTVTDPDLVCIPRELVEQARATAPARDRGLTKGPANRRWRGGATTPNFGSG